MDHRWRADPGPLQGNICPRCSTPHFPFCLPNLNPRFPVVHNPPSTDQLHIRNHPALSPHSTLHLSHGPHFSEGSPNFNLAHNNQFQPSSAILDRGSKRLKMDGTHLDSYPTEVNDERRLKLIHEHGGGMNGISPNAQYYNQTSHETLAAHTNYQAGCLHSDLYGCANTPHYDRRTNTPAQNYPLGGYAQPYTIRRPDQTIYRCGPVSLSNDSRLLTESRTPTMEGYPVPASYPRHYASSNYANPTNEDTNVQLPLTPPPLRAPLPPPYDMPQQWITQPKYSTGSARSTFLFPVDVRSSTSAPSLYPPVPEVHSTYQHIPHPLHSSGGFFVKDSQGPQTEMYQLSGQAQHVVLKHIVSDKPKMVDVFSLFKPPNRDRRPDHFVIILRGLPGSGKSYFARMIRNLELENGGKAPRIHSMDDYFMTEVDKVEENETSKSSVRGKKPVVKKVLEYCYEAEMEEAYRSSMLKAFKKTLDEGFFTIVIVDDRNLRVADFAQFWATAKRSGYEVYLLETSYNDPVGCKARNIHGFTRHDIEKMAGLWEEAPSLYLQLDAKSLLHRDDLKESNIKEVDMDMDDEELYRGSSGLEERKQGDVTAKTAEEVVYDGSANKKILDAEADHPDEEIKDLKCSKWSGDLDEDNVEVADKMKHKSTSISGMFHAYGKEGKSVCWGDQIPNTGFSIGPMKKENAASLIIGPGSGYNLKSNPLVVEEAAVRNGDVKKKRSVIVFQEHLRAERESFKAVFDQRRQRIGRE